MARQNDGPTYEGLTTEQAERLLAEHGPNELVPVKQESLIKEVLKAFTEPMFLLLIAAAVIYFFLGEPRDGAIMLVFVLGMIGIDIVQQWKTDKTLRALRELSAPRVAVVRDGVEKTVPSATLVPGDLMLLEEGVKIPADGEVLRASDLCVDESSLTGEAEGVWKTPVSGTSSQKEIWRRDCCYAGTLVLQGSAAVRVTKTGAATEYGKIGAHVAAAPDKPTPLQRQTGRLVALSAGIAAVLFVLVCGLTWLNLTDHQFRDRLVESILAGITLAMAMIPEEFPVILTVFLSMGAWRLAKKHSLVRRLPAVETLGAVSVLCVDKTGTITMNRMTVREAWAPEGEETALCETMGMACETEAYDPMEQAMLAYCGEKGVARETLFSGSLLKEYPFTHEAKRMGHVWRREEGDVVAAKGSAESILPLCGLAAAQRAQAEEKAAEMSRRGLRVIAVGRMPLAPSTEPPETLDACALQFCGLVGLADPPRESVKEDIARCTRAGVRVVMITGDNGVTAGAIAQQVGMPGCCRAITGEELSRMTDDELQKQVKNTNIFSRVMPEHKMRIVRALQANGEVVAMTGDGVNDAAALRHADIGIAMGRRGSEVSREAADLVLLDDNFTTIVDTVRDGRRIYDNIKKAVGYVFTIHIPIAFASLLAPLLGVPPTALMLLPLHIVLLELVIDPTCSIVLERQPAEHDIMERPPRSTEERLLDARGLIKSVAQGLAVFAASFGSYYFTLQANPQTNAPAARAMGLCVILLSNLLLVQVNSSRTDSALRSLRRLLKDRVMQVVGAGTLLGLAVLLYSPVNGFLALAPLSAGRLALAVGLACAAVLWYEPVKLFVRLKKRRNAARA